MTSCAPSEFPIPSKSCFSVLACLRSHVEACAKSCFCLSQSKYLLERAFSSRFSGSQSWQVIHCFKVWGHGGIDDYLQLKGNSVNRRKDTKAPWMCMEWPALIPQRGKCGQHSLPGESKARCRPVPLTKPTNLDTAPEDRSFKNKEPGKVGG